MKKALSLILILVLLLTLCACGKGGDQTDATGGTTGESVNDQTEGATQATSGNEGTTATTGDTNDETGATEPAGTTATQPAPTTCSHTFSDATCTAAKTCTKCGATEGSAAGHSWKDATCAAPKTCATCGATEGGNGSHTFTPDCTICGQPNEGYVPVGQSSWRYVIKGDGERLECSYDFFDSVADQGVNISYTTLITLEKFGQKYNMTIDEIRAEYTDMEMIKTVDGVEYIFDGWGMDNWSSRRYKEENGVVTVEFLSLDWDENDNEVWTVKHTVVMKRTGMAELTVTSSDYEDTPVGTKLAGEYFGS